MPSVHTDDRVSISYKTFGSGPRNLLFLHGWGGSANYWDEMLKYVDLTGLRAIAASFRGHGDSDKPATGYTIERFAKDMFAVADHANAEKFVLVGFSMSGKYAQYMTLMDPNRVLGQVLIAPCPAIGFPIPPETCRLWCDCQGNPDKFREVLAPFSKVPIKPELMDAFLKDCARVPRVALEETLNMITGPSFIDKVREIRVPTLAIGGLADPMLPPDYVREMVASPIPGARLALLDCGHETPQELPQETAALLEAFLAGLQ